MEKQAYIISFDLRNKTKNYSALYNEIKSLGDWMHPQEPLWLLLPGDLSVDAEALYNKLRPNIEDSDLMFIVEISHKDREGWMPKTFWEKLKLAQV